VEEWAFHGRQDYNAAVLGDGKPVQIRHCPRNGEWEESSQCHWRKPGRPRGKARKSGDRPGTRPRISMRGFLVHTPAGTQVGRSKMKLAIVALAACAALPALAEETPTPLEPVVVTGTRSAQEQNRLPADVIV